MIPLVRRIRTGLAAALALTLAAVTFAAEPYFPPRGAWERRTPEEVGMDSAKLQEAIDFSLQHEATSPRDNALDLQQTFGKSEPLFKIMGPTSPRGGITGIVIRQGYVVATWGEPDRVDMTYSITKTFLTTVTGLAHERVLIRNLDDRVGPYLPVPEQDLFASAHNAPITWTHLLRQTSDWSGTLWDMPDWADRPVGATPADHPHRPLHAPGSFFKYNDVRINLLSLATLHVWRRPLPAVLHEEIMEPIGASSTWRWHGYENSWVTIDGQRMQSVSGGGHLGGGMFINAWDLARFGYLFFREGRWAGRQLVSRDWIALARSPGPANAEYGFANWYLNPGRKSLSETPESSITFRGNGWNIIYLDPENDLVVVMRWIDRPFLNPFLGKVIGAIKRERSP